MIVLGAQSQDIVVKWGYDYIPGTGIGTVTLSSIAPAEYGVGEYGIAEYSSNQVTNLVTIPASGSGTVVQIGFEAQLESQSISIQKIDIHSKEGRL
jgi:hypothetical protein